MTDETVLAPADIEADFVFRCYDDSMVFSHLFSDDLVFIKSCTDVEDGQIAVVRIGESFILRRVYHFQGSIELRSENPSYPPIITQEFEILGAAVKALCSVV